MKIFRNIVLGIVFFIFISWMGELVKCEILTYKYYDVFEELYRQNEILGDIEYFKVINYAPYEASDLARIYFVGKGYTVGIVLTFKYNYEKNLWEEVSWDTIWSGVGGSASEVIWPYWWHFVYGGI